MSLAGLACSSGSGGPPQGLSSLWRRCEPEQATMTQSNNKRNERNRMKDMIKKTGLIAVPTVLAASAASAQDALIDVVETSVTSIAGDAATAFGFGLAIFAVIYGGRKILRALKAAS